MSCGVTVVKPTRKEIEEKVVKEGVRQRISHFWGYVSYHALWVRIYDNLPWPQ